MRCRKSIYFFSRTPPILTHPFEIYHIFSPHHCTITHQHQDFTPLYIQYDKNQLLPLFRTHTNNVSLN